MTTGAVLQSGAAKRPAVVAVVVSWNSGPWLPACLEALAVQSGPDLRIVVWDNGSEPATLAVIDAARVSSDENRVVEVITPGQRPA